MDYKTISVMPETKDLFDELFYKSKLKKIKIKSSNDLVRLILKFCNENKFLEKEDGKNINNKSQVKE